MNHKSTTLTKSLPKANFSIYAAKSSYRRSLLTVEEDVTDDHITIIDLGKTAEGVYHPDAGNLTVL